MVRAAFTLIELLVVISIIALLLAIVVPALGAVRDSALDMRCKSNQGQVMKGYLSVLMDFDGLTPTTYNSPDPHMKDYVQAAFPQLQPLRSRQPSDTSAFNVCPVIDSEFDRPGYGGIFTGFAVNTRLRSGGEPGDNERIPWATIRNPSSYPWMADPWVQSVGVASGIFGYSASAADWGLGFYHGGYESGNAAFADGHVDGITRADLSEVDESGEPVFLFDGRR